MENGYLIVNSKNLIMKFYTLLFFLLLFGLSNAQTVVVEMNNGTTKEGEMGLVTTEMKTFKLKPKGGKGKAQFLKKGDVKSITYYLPNGVVIAYERVKAYKNAKNKKIAKEDAFLEVVYNGENIKLFHAYQNSSYYRNVATDEYYFCLRPGEEAAHIVSWIFGGQVNKNAIFRKVAADYFKDYPELSQKIKKREYKYQDIIDVVVEYDNWKSGK